MNHKAFYADKSRVIGLSTNDKFRQKLVGQTVKIISIKLAVRTGLEIAFCYCISVCWGQKG
jgi:hypothetical protein